MKSKAFELKEIDKLKFWKHVERIPEHSCWEWIGRKNNTGYGYHRISNKPDISILAHRLSLLINGQKLINGLVVDHKCRNKTCVNPKHLRQVTPRINTIENNDTPAAINHRKKECPKGHKYSFRPKENNKRRCKICESVYKKEYRKKHRLHINAMAKLRYHRIKK